MSIHVFLGVKDTIFSNLKVGNLRCNWAALLNELVPITLQIQKKKYI